MRAIQEHVHHPDSSFRYLRFPLRAASGRMHRHDQLELTWIERGAGVRFIGDDVSAFGDDDLVLVGANLAHTWMSTKAPEGSEFFATVLQFKDEFFAQPGVPEMAQLRPLLARANQGLKISGATHAAVTQQLVRLQNFVDGVDPLGQYICFVEIFRALHLRPLDLSPIAGFAAVNEKERASERRIDKVINWLHAHFADTLLLADAAKVAHVSPAAFSRFFHRETGKTFTAYVNDVRCAEACVKLRQSSVPIATIAAQCGFKSTSQFNRQFLSHTQLSPRAYRQNTN